MNGNACQELKSIMRFCRPASKKDSVEESGKTGVRAGKNSKAKRIELVSTAMIGTVVLITRRCGSFEIDRSSGVSEP